MERETTFFCCLYNYIFFIRHFIYIFIRLHIMRGRERERVGLFQNWLIAYLLDVVSISFNYTNGFLLRLYCLTLSNKINHNFFNNMITSRV